MSRRHLCPTCGNELKSVVLDDIGGIFTDIRRQVRTLNKRVEKFQRWRSMIDLLIVGRKQAEVARFFGVTSGAVSAFLQRRRRAYYFSVLISRVRMLPGDVSAAELLFAFKGCDQVEDRVKRYMDRIKDRVSAEKALEW